jgi:hypothetical protein
MRGWRNLSATTRCGSSTTRCDRDRRAQMGAGAVHVPADPRGERTAAPGAAPGNVEKLMTAPVTAIVAYDLKFYEKLPRLFPHAPHMRARFADAPDLVDVTAKRNSSLQGAYLILAARALGLDCGPLSGFDNARVDEEFFAAGKPCDGCDQEFFPEGHVSPTSCATSGTAIRRSSIRATRASASTRRARSSDAASLRPAGRSRRAAPSGPVPCRMSPTGLHAVG